MLKELLEETIDHRSASPKVTPPNFIIWPSFRWNLPKSINPFSCFNVCFLDGCYLFSVML